MVPLFLPTKQWDRDEGRLDQGVSMDVRKVVCKCLILCIAQEIYLGLARGVLNMTLLVVLCLTKRWQMAPWRECGCHNYVFYTKEVHYLGKIIAFFQPEWLELRSQFSSFLGDLRILKHFPTTEQWVGDQVRLHSPSPCRRLGQGQQGFLIRCCKSFYS